MHSYDEVRILEAPVNLEHGIKAPEYKNTCHHKETYGDNTVSYYYV